jgi:hypothetical protein
MRLKLLACEIFYRELSAATARSINQIDVEFLPKGLHDIGQTGMSARLKEVLAAVDESHYDAVLLGYALCSNGLLGLAARKIPLIVPRAHDCITLFLGSKERYLDYFYKNPGVYFKTSGWIERGEGLAQLGQDYRDSPDVRGQHRAAMVGEKGTAPFAKDSIQNFTGLNYSYQELVAKYGEDNAKFLQEQLGNITRNYGKIAFIEMGIEPDDRFEQKAHSDAASLGWKFEKLQGDMSLIQDLLDGRWDDSRFLTVPPGFQIAPSYDAQIIKADKTT